MMPVQRPVQSILETSRDTPIVELRRLGAKGRLFAKCELFSATQSHKDRTAFDWIDDAERRGVLRKGATVIEASTGNFAISLAQACAARGYRFIAVMPESMSLERRETLKLYGAQVELTPAQEHIDGAIFRRDQLRAENPDAFCPSQFDNDAHIDAVERSLGRELVEAAKTLGRADAFISGASTASTLVGAVRAMRKAFPKIEVFVVEPKESAVLQRNYPEPHRVHGVAARFVPAHYEPKLVDGVIAISSADAWAMQRRLAKEEGLLVGPSSGANVHAALAYAKANPAANVFTLLYDTGERYFTVMPKEGELSGPPKFAQSHCGGGH